MNTKIIPQFNLGLVGHVDHGKTTLVSKLSGKWTDTHSEEIKRGITIRLGYANVAIYECPKCESPNKYSVSEKCPVCGTKGKLVRAFSLVDAPGHESLMATMLAGTTIMDGALLLIAADEKCPQPQTREHLMALDIAGIKKIIVVQNKIDLVGKERALENYKEIKEFLKGTSFEDSPIIPISAFYGTNLNLLIEAIVNYFPVPKRDKTKEPVMVVARSFDINRPGTQIEKLHGGILGGALKQGVLKVGDEIEIKPGVKINKKGRVYWQPLKTKICSIQTGDVKIDEASPGGSVAIETLLDPFYVRADGLMGNVVGHPGKLPPVFDELSLEVHLLDRVAGTAKDLKVEPLKINEPIMLNVNSAATMGIINSINKDSIRCKLRIPVCAEKKSRVTISRVIDNRWRLIGYAIIN